MKLHFFIFTESFKQQREYIKHIRRSKRGTIVSFSQQRSYRIQWPSLQRYIETVQKQCTAKLVLLPEEEWWRDLRGEILIALWELLRNQESEELFVIIPPELAVYLHKHSTVLYGRTLYWKLNNEYEPGEMFYFDLSNPQQEILKPLREFTLLELIQKSHGHTAVV